MINKNDIEQYFLAEKNGAMLVLIAGIIAVVLGIVFLFLLKASFYKGAAYVLIAAGLLQSVIGYRIYSTSDKHRIDTVYAYDMNPGNLKNQELPRVKKAISGIQIFLLVEAVLMVAGAIIYLKNNNIQGNLVWKGAALFLVIEGLLLLFVDIPALKRNRSYLEQLVEFTQRK